MASYYTYGTIPSVDETGNNPLSNYGVEFTQPTEENEVLAPVGGLDTSNLSDEDRRAIMSSLFASLAAQPIRETPGGLPGFGAGFTGLPTGIPPSNLILPGSGGADLVKGNLYEPATEAAEYWKQQAGTRGAELSSQLGQQELAKYTPEQLAQAEQAGADIAAYQEEQIAEEKQRYQETLPERRELSSLLKSNRFEEAFDYAKANNLVDLITDPAQLKNLRDPFTKDEAAKFMEAVPPDLRGDNYLFDPKAGLDYATGQWQGETGFVSPLAAFQAKPDNTVKNIALTMAALMLGHMAAPALFGASGSAAGAGAGAAGTGAGAGAGAGTSGALSGLKSAYQTVAAIPTKIGSTVANALGFPINSTIAQTSFGNSLISGATTAAKGGDIGDIIKSGLLAAGVTYGLDAAANAVKGIMPDISKAVGSEVSNAAATSGVSPTSALDALQEVVVTAKKVSDVAGLAGAATGAVAPSPEKATLEKAEKPEDLEEVTVTGRRIKVPPTITPVPAPEPSPIEAAQPEPVFEPAPTVDDLQEIEVTGKRIDTPPVVVSTPSPIETPFEPAPTVDDLQEIEVTGKRIDTPPVVVPPPSPLDALEEVVVTGKRTEPYIPEPPPIIINPADILKDYKPTEVKEDLNLKSILEKFGTLENILKLLGGLGSVGSKTESVTAPQTTGGLGGALPKYTYTRQQLQPDIDYYTYGTRPEAKFFEYNQQVEKPEQPVGIVPPKDQPVFASGGLTNYAHGGESESQYVQGPGSGRDDKIPALLSDGEYVIDAETLALLGDGSTKEGARRMDQFRANIRQHKGRALSRGRISPNAKSPDKYMGGGLT